MDANGQYDQYDAPTSDAPAEIPSRLDTLEKEIARNSQLLFELVERLDPVLRQGEEREVDVARDHEEDVPARTHLGRSIERHIASLAVTNAALEGLLPRLELGE